MRVVLLGLSLLFLGCGGRVEGEDGGSEDESTSADGGEDPADPDGTDPGDLTLDECEPGGPLYEAGDECNWLAEDLCYLTKVAACECICPRDGPSLCLSDFYGGEGSQTKVSCR
jgi:hypothetical protein